MLLLLNQLNLEVSPSRIWYVVGPSSGWADPTDDEIVAGQLSGGGPPTASGSEVSPTATVDPFDYAEAATGLTSGVSYRIAYVWWDGVLPIDGTHASNVVVSAPFAFSSGRLKVWNGSAWVTRPLKVWGGAAWAPKPLEYWNGSAWVT